MTTRNREEISKTQKFLLREYNEENTGKVQFEFNNIYNLGDEKFDFVFCFGVLYHLKNPYLALENLFKITRETLVIETQGIKDEKYLGFNRRFYQTFFSFGLLAKRVTLEVLLKLMTKKHLLRNMRINQILKYCFKSF